MRFIYDNLLDDATLTASTENANYPSSNLKKIHLTTTWRTTALTSQTLVLNAGTGAVMSADCIVIAGHNLSESASVSIQASSSDSWASPGFSAAVTWRDGIIVYYFASSQQEQYYRFLIDDQTNSDDYIEIGRIALSEYFEPSTASLAEFPIRYIRTDRTDDSIANQMYGDQGVSYRMFEYSFPPLAATAFANIKTMWDTVGKYKPFFFMNFSTRFTEIEPAYVRFDGEDITGNYKQNFFVEHKLLMRETG